MLLQLTPQPEANKPPSPKRVRLDQYAIISSFCDMVPLLIEQNLSENVVGPPDENNLTQLNLFCEILAAKPPSPTIEAVSNILNALKRIHDVYHSAKSEHDYVQQLLITALDKCAAGLTVSQTNNIIPN